MIERNANGEIIICPARHPEMAKWCHLPKHHDGDHENRHYRFVEGGASVLVGTTKWPNESKKKVKRAKKRSGIRRAKKRGKSKGAAEEG